jgi:hypothetical protein
MDKTDERNNLHAYFVAVHELARIMIECSVGIQY